MPNYIVFKSECEKLTIQTMENVFMCSFDTTSSEQIFCIPNNIAVISLFTSALDSITENPTFDIDGTIFQLALSSIYSYNIIINGVSMILDNEASLLFYRFWKELL